MKPVKRYDTVELGAIRRADDGSIQSDAVITRTGVFAYELPSGAIQYEYRSPEEVFNADSMASAKMEPITNNHPPEFVTPENAKDVAVGFTGENVRQSGKFLVVPVKINTADGIAAVESGRRQFSCGYQAEVVEERGTCDGIAYTHAQKNIRHNHLALVDKGRAGPDASLRLDSSDAVMVADDAKDTKARKEPAKMSQETVQIKFDNGCTYDVPKEVEAEFAVIRKDVGDKASKIDSLTSERDKLQGELDAAKAELEKAQKVDTDALVRDGIKARLDLIGKAQAVLDEEAAKKLDEMDDKAIKVAVIVSTDEKFDAEGKSDDHINARFDAALSYAGKKKKSDDSGKGGRLAGDGKHEDGAEEKVDAEEKRDAALKAQREYSLTGKRPE
jgi:hypothetical protein